jgi:hypothetical protein
MCAQLSLLCRLLYVAWPLLIPIAAYCQNLEVRPDVQTIKNEQIELGFDMNRGGSICHLSSHDNKVNVINHYDNGRFVQQSYYGDHDGSKWNDKPWRWNAVQGGSFDGKPSKVISSRFSQTTSNIVTQPTHWATGEPITDAEMSTSATVEGKLAHVTYRFTYNGRNHYKPTHQELPAVFADASLKTLVFYAGASPWQECDLTRVTPGWPNKSHDVDEHWAAYVNGEDWGLGVYSPRMKHITSYRFPEDGSDNPRGNACSYFAPIETFAIEPNFDLKYDVWLTIGSVAEIRNSFKEVRQGTTLKRSGNEEVGTRAGG